MPLGTEVGFGPGNIVLDGTELSPRIGAQQPPPLFGPCHIVAKRSPISATAELVFYCASAWHSCAQRDAVMRFVCTVCLSVCPSIARKRAKGTPEVMVIIIITGVIPMRT